MTFGSWSDFKFAVLYCLVATLLVRDFGFVSLRVDIGHSSLGSSFSRVLGLRVAIGHFGSVLSLNLFRGFGLPMDTSSRFLCVFLTEDLVWLPSDIGP